VRNALEIALAVIQILANITLPQLLALLVKDIVIMVIAC
jgi:hypothetical protein